MTRTWIILWLALINGLRLCADDINWPQFRGPRGDGCSTSTGLPIHWGDQAGGSGIKWKTAIHGRAWSSPVIWSEQIWLTTATENGRELFVVCVDKDSGKISRDMKVFDVAKPQFAHQFNTYASPTPVIEEGRVYATFGAPGTACLDTQTGKVLWTRRDLECNHYRGAGSSPIIYQDLFILNFDGSDHQFIIALDKKTGHTVWQKNRSVDYKDLDPDGRVQSEGDFRKGFATCQIALLEGQATLLSQGAKAFYAYDPLTGEEFWRIEERTSHSGATRPVYGQGLIFVLRPVGTQKPVAYSGTNASAETIRQHPWRLRGGSTSSAKKERRLSSPLTGNSKSWLRTNLAMVSWLRLRYPAKRCFCALALHCTELRSASG